MNKDIPILPIGPVNTKTGANHKFGSVFSAWPDGAFMLVQDINGSLRGVASRGSVESLSKQFPIGATLPLCHDQTRKRIGNYDHTVLGHYPMSLVGLHAVRSHHQAGALQMSTLK